MHGENFRQLRANGADRVQAGTRILEDHCDLGRPNCAKGGVALRRHGLAREPDATGGHGQRMGEHAKDGLPDHRFARAAFPNQAERLAPIDLKADLTHGLGAVAVGGQGNRQSVNGEERRRRRRLLGVWLTHCGPSYKDGRKS